MRTNAREVGKLRARYVQNAVSWEAVYRIRIKMLAEISETKTLRTDTFSYMIVIYCPGSRVMSFICATQMTQTASYNAVPSMLTVAPKGRTKRLIRWSTPLFSSTQRMVVGRVAALQKRDRKYHKYTWPSFSNNTIQYNTIQYDTIRYDTIQYNTIPLFKHDNV